MEIRNGSAVDHEAQEYDRFCNVYKDESGNVYSATMNQAMAGGGGMNGYYKLQLFETKIMPHK